MHPDWPVMALAALIAALGASVSFAAPAVDDGQASVVQCVAYLDSVGATEDEVISQKFQTTISIPADDPSSINSPDFGVNPLTEAFEAHVARQFPDRRVSGHAVCMSPAEVDEGLAALQSRNAIADTRGDGFRIDPVQTDWPPTGAYPVIQVATNPILQPSSGAHSSRAGRRCAGRGSHAASVRRMGARERACRRTTAA
jgi:hypothetical protein